MCRTAGSAAQDGEPFQSASPTFSLNHNMLACFDGLLAARHRLQDLYGLLAFLRVEPLADSSLFKRTLERPVKSGDPVGLARLQARIYGP